MCIIFVALRQHPDYPLIIAANRDEFYARPTQHSHFWPQSPALLAGKDLKAGGSWMGITRDGNFAALTNIRDPSREQTTPSSRGALVTDFLRAGHPITEYSHRLHNNAHRYNGYNLLFGNYQHLAVFNSHRRSLEHLANGFHGLSNAQLNTPWPKMNRGISALKEYVVNTKTLLSDDLFTLLTDDTPALPDQLPDTGVPKEWEQRLSPIFIRTPEYGTRSSTVLMITKNAEINWFERVFPVPADMSTLHFERYDYSWKIQQE
ncbi:MAG: NRDE family protein [Alteromonadaceae bacterium]|nr:NRDE family protein [Alteromonadaceae bacterium]